MSVERIAESVVKSIAEPLRVGEARFVIKPSIGIALYPTHGSNAKELIVNADAAMYLAKKPQTRGNVRRVPDPSRMR